MVKKIGSAGLLLGGLLAVTGMIVIFSAAGSSGSGNTIMGMAVMARIGAILMLASAITALIGASIGGFRKGGAIVALIFSIFAFIGQILINPLTNTKAAISAAGSLTALGNTAAGMVMLLVTGAVGFVMGIVGICKKTRPNG